MSEIAHEGGCLCGAVRFRARGAPLRTLACHCRFCQRMTGTSFYAESMFDIDAVEYTGAMNCYSQRSATSGQDVHVHFCPSCGSTLGLTFDRWPQYRAVSRGSFDNPNWVEIGSHIWLESAQTGVMLPAGVDCFMKARASMQGTPEAPVRHAGPVPARD